MLVQSIPYPAGGGGPTGDVTIAVQGFATNQTSPFDVTDVDLNGKTLAAAFAVTSYGEVGATGETPRLSLSFGFRAGSATNATWTGSNDASASTLVRRAGYTDRFYNVRNPGNATITESATASFIAEGVRLTRTNSTGTNFQAQVALFADVQAHTGTINLGTGTTAIDVTAPGFEPDLVLFSGVNGDFGGTTANFMGAVLGFALKTGEQFSVSWAEANGAAAGAPVMQVRDSAAAVQVNATTGAADYTVTASTFDANGFSVTPSASASSDVIAYLALKFDPSKQLKLQAFSTPTSTGNQTISGVGFRPQFALVVLTNMEAYNTAGASDLSSALSVSMIGNNQWSTAWRTDHGADPTDTASNCQNVALLGGSATATDAIEATLVGFTADGMALNYSAVQGTAKHGFILFVE